MGNTVPADQEVADGWSSSPITCVGAHPEAQPELSANTHYRFRHLAVGSPYLYYVK